MTRDHRYAMIMAGGSGTRLWPMSRAHRPKQLLPFIGGRSLLDIAASRLDDLIPPSHRYICTGEAYRPLIRSSLPAFDDEHILGEPIGRDTVNAVGFTAVALSQEDDDAIFAVLTADHLIEPQHEFKRCFEIGYELVEADPSRFVTFAITPTSPATGFGYLEIGEPISGFDDAAVVKQFVEKPDLETAVRYVASGSYGWNSGMFIFHARTFLAALEQFLPESYEGLMSIGDAWKSEERAKVLANVYPTLPKISVDFAVMEPASHDTHYTICCVPMTVNWMDVGSWPSYGETLNPDRNDNRTNAQLVQLDSKSVLAVSDDASHTIATIGCEDLIIIRTKDVTLVCPQDHAQRVKDLVKEADESLR